MDSPKITYRYYSNPAFCAQSEVVFTQQSPCVSPRITSSAVPDRTRMPPLGANSPRKPQTYERIRQSNNRIKTDISDNPLRIINSGNGPLRYVKDEPPELPPKPAKFAHSRNNSTSSTLQRQRSLIRTSKRSNASVTSRSRSEDLEMSSLGMRYQDIKISDDENKNSITNHRYEVIRDMDDIDYSPTKKRIIESETDEYNVDAPDDNEFKAIPTEIVKTVNGKTHRYAIIPSDDEETPKRLNVTFSSPPMSKKHLIATQKLHELLSTPRKTTLKSYASQPSVRMVSSEPRVRSRDAPQVYQVTPSRRMTSTPNKGVTPSKSCANLTVSPKSSLTSPVSPRAQQKLNYGLPEPDFEISPRQKTVSPDFTRQTTVSPDFLARGYRQRSFDRTLETSSRRDGPRSLDLDRREGPRSLDIDRREGPRSLDLDRRDGNRSLDLDRERSPEWDRRADANRSVDFERYGREVGRSRFFDRERRSPKKVDRTTAVITPRLAVQQSPSVYSEDGTYKSWNSLKTVNTATATLAIAALMMCLCGGLTAGLGFYMMYAIGRLYYLDFAVLSGFTCLLLGMLGFRTRTYQLLPNRNYISGYIVLSTFSILSGAGLLSLLVLAPSPGTALNDVTSGAVCGLSVLSLCVATWGVLASYCCETPPPDNRVGHA